MRPWIIGIGLTIVAPVTAAGLMVSYGNILANHADHITLFFTIVTGLSPIVYYLRSLNTSIGGLRDEVRLVNESLIEVTTLVKACPFCMRRNGNE